MQIYSPNSVLTAVAMKMAVCWVVAPCGLVWVYRRFGDVYCLHHQGDESITQRTQTSVRSVRTQQTAVFSMTMSSVSPLEAGMLRYKTALHCLSSHQPAKLDWTRCKTWNYLNTLRRFRKTKMSWGTKFVSMNRWSSWHLREKPVSGKGQTGKTSKT
jgi:hypothetical protein